jgi:hypothetical protein
MQKSGATSKHWKIIHQDAPCSRSRGPTQWNSPKKIRAGMPNSTIVVSHPAGPGRRNCFTATVY